MTGSRKRRKPHATELCAAPSLPPIRPHDLADAEGVLREQRRLYVAARMGQLPLADACRLAYLLGLMLKGIETVTLERRIAVLEHDASQPPRPH